jgi:hypothetical protein
MVARSTVTGDREWREEPVDRHHDRSAFDCGVPALNEYLSRYARQNAVSGGARSFVAVLSGEPTRVLGYYTIGPGSVDFAKVPSNILKRLGRYDIPVYRLARLAVNLPEQGRLLGSRLLFAAGRRALMVAAHIGGAGLAIDAKDERAARWYAGFGAVSLRDDPLRLLLPFETIAKAIRQADDAKL